mgnify:CR=1 FL=1
MSGLVRHHDEDPKKQRCPQQLMDGKDGVTWDKFKAMVEGHLKGNDIKPTTPQKAPEAPKKASAEQVAQDIANGRGGWGNNPERAKKLTKDGYDAKAVQARVNDILKPKTKPKAKAPSVNVESLAKQVVRGIDTKGRRIPNGVEARAKHFGISVDAMRKVQKRVNQILS